MNTVQLAKSVPWVVAILGLTTVALWLRGPATGLAVSPRLPGSDRLGLDPSSRPAPIELRGVLETGNGSPAAFSSNWPRFRGAHFDNISREMVRLTASWGNKPPALLWSIALGEGYAGAAIRNGRVYVLDYDAQRQADVLKCLSLEDGAMIWQRSYSVEVKRNHGMSRTVPAVTDKFVVTIGPKCHVVCLEAISGEYLWGIDLVAEHKTKVPPWYAGQCPLIDNDTAILAPAGDVLMMAIDCGSGRMLWQTPNSVGWEMSHSSIIPMTIGDRRTYVYCGSGGVAGVDATDGRLLWSSSDWKVSMACVPSPVVIDESHLFLSGGYGAGSMMLKLTATPTGFAAEPEYRLTPEVFGSEQQTPIFYQGHIYGVIPGGQLVCLDLSGRQVWTSGPRRFGLGPYLLADGKILVMNDSGRLFAIDASPAEYRELAQHQLIEDGHESWAPMALAGGRLVARDWKQMVCVDLRENP